MRIRSAPGPFAALVAKDLLVLTGRPGLWLARTGFVAILFATIAAAWYVVGEDPADPARLTALGRTIQRVLSIGGILLSSLAVSTIAVGAVVEERTKGGLEILYSAPVSRFRLALSHVASSLILAGGFLAAAVPLLAIPLFVGGVAPSDIVVWVILPCVLSCSASAAIAVGLACIERASPVASVVLGFFMPVYISGMLLMVADKVRIMPALFIAFQFLNVLVMSLGPVVGIAWTLIRGRDLPRGQRARRPAPHANPRLRLGLPCRGLAAHIYFWSGRNAFVARAMLHEPVFAPDAGVGLGLLIAAALLLSLASVAAVVTGDSAIVAEAGGIVWFIACLGLPIPIILACIEGFRMLPVSSEPGLLDALLSSPLRGRDIATGGLAVAAHRARVGAVAVAVVVLPAGILSTRPLLGLAGIAFLCVSSALAYAIALWVRLLVPRSGPAGALTFVILIVPVIAWFIAAPMLPVALRLQSWFTMEPSIEVGMALGAGLAGFAATVLLAGFEAFFDRAMGRPAATGAKA